MTHEGNMGEDTLAIFSVEYADGNWLALLNKGSGKKSPEDGRIERYVVHFRFRWYRDAKVWDSADKRSFYVGILKPDILTDSHAIEHTREMVQVVALTSTLRTGKRPAQWELVRGARSMPEFLDALEQMPGISMKRVGI